MKYIHICTSPSLNVDVRKKIHRNYALKDWARSAKIILIGE